MPDSVAIRLLLEPLRGNGFTVNLFLPGGGLVGQKVVAIENGLVYTVDAAGNTCATVITQIQRVEF